MQAFSCMAEDCPDTCCAGWDIVFDEVACDRYRDSPDLVLREAFEQNVIRNDEETADGSVPFARVKLTTDCRCPYLRMDGLCTIQYRSEEKNLSETCRTHPRVLRFWGEDYAELSLQLSCPMAARLILTEKPLDFIAKTVEPAELHGLRSQQETGPQGIQFRNVLIYILQRREYPLRERLLLANHFFWQAVELEEDTQASFLNLLDDVLAILADPQRMKAVGTSIDEGRAALRLEALRSLLLHRIAGIRADPELQELIDWLLVHWTLQDKVIPAGLCHYEQDCIVAQQQFFQQHEQNGENYLVNQVFKAGSLFASAGGADKWGQLIFQYVLQQVLLTAAVNRAGGKLSLDEAADLVQKITKLVEHDAVYLQQAAAFLQMLQLDKETGIAVLIGKN